MVKKNKARCSQRQGQWSGYADVEEKLVKRKEALQKEI